MNSEIKKFGDNLKSGMNLRVLLAGIVSIVMLLTVGCASDFSLRKLFDRESTQQGNAGQSDKDRDEPGSEEHGDSRINGNNGHSTDSLDVDLQKALFWYAQSDSDLVLGDTLAAAESLVLGIEFISKSLDKLPLTERLAWVDTLANWSMNYSRLLGGEFVSMDPGESGLAGLSTEIMATEADTLLTEMVEDTFSVQIDSTLDFKKRLPEIPDTLNATVQSVIDYFSGTPKGRKAMETWIERAGHVIPRMEAVLKHHGMPEDLVFLAMIESGFRNDAHSYARAVGPWQFIYSTAKTFNLEADWWYDERRDYELATDGASRFLHQLYDHLGDWYLAMAAYNCGEGRVKREIRRSSSRNFWDLRRLPRQTRHYVPTFLAARRIITNPEEYGFNPMVFEDRMLRDSVIITECVDMAAIADVAKVDLEELHKLNPAILRWCTPPNRDSVVVYLPEGKSEGFWDKYAEIPDDKKTSWARHKIQTGESLSLIANKYKTTVRAIMDVPANKLSNPNRITVGHHILVPVAPVGTSVDYSRVMVADYDSPDGMEKRIHKVRRGDTLSEIAEQYHVGLSKLLRWNSMHKRSVIRPGQKLIVYQPAGSSPKPAKMPSNGESVSYTIKRGDTMWEIARDHGVLLSALLSANNMNRDQKIHVGDRIVVPGKASNAVHLVQQGDTLSGIASNFNVSVTDLMKWNNLSDANHIKPGDRLVIQPGGGS